MNIEHKKTLRELKLIRILVERGSYNTVYPTPTQRDMVLTVLNTAIFGLEGSTDYPLAVAREICECFEDENYARLLLDAARLTSAGLALGDDNERTND